jgi:outer membrane protein TolC
VADVVARTAQVALAVALVCGAWPARAEVEAEGLALPELEKRALERYPEIEAARAKVERLEAQLTELRWRPLSGIRVQGTLSPTPERRGDALHALQGDISFGDTWGVLVRTQLDVRIPVYTFGRLWAERDAALRDIEVGRDDVRSKQRQVLEQVQRAYYTLQLARQSQSLLDEGRGYIGRAQRYIDRSLEDDRGDVTETDRLQVEVIDAEVEARTADARRGIRIATAALRTLAGLGADEAIATPPLEPAPLTLGKLPDYQRAAAEARPELAAAEERLAAARARRRAARASFFPEIAFVTNLDHAYSNIIDDQLNPFVYDPYNHLRFTFGLTLRWDLDFGTDRARVHQAEARIREAEADGEALRQRVGLEVEQAYIDVDENQRVVEARHRARRASRGWLISILQGIDVGVLEPPELVDALRAYFEQSFLYLEAVSSLNASIDRLGLVVGAPVDAAADE